MPVKRIPRRLERLRPDLRQADFRKWRTLSPISLYQGRAM